MTDKPSAYHVLLAIEEIGKERRKQLVTRVEIAAHLDVHADDISREGGSPTGPLGQAATGGLIEEDPSYRGYWRLTPAGETALDSAAFNA
jgi:hypothetical protein